MCLSGLIDDDSIEIIHLYQLSLGGFACCDNYLHLIDNLLYNLIFDSHEMLKLFFCKTADTVLEVFQKIPFFSIL
jgi:hypothetical protein